MTPLPILDLIAGLIFIFFLLAVINNSLFEIFSALFKLRASYLGDWLKVTFKNPVGAKTLATSLMDHPLLCGLTKNGTAPAYMNAKSFAPALIEIIFTHEFPDQKAFTIENIKASIEKTTVLPKELKNIFLLFIEKTNAAQLAAKAANSAINEIEHFEQQVASWFDNIMERVGGRFKRHVLLFTVLFATIITTALNVDSLSLANYLYSNPDARQKWAAESYGTVNDSATIAQVNLMKQKNNAIVEKDSTKEEMVAAANENLDAIIKDVKTQKQIVQKTINSINADLPIGWNQHEKAALKEHPVKKLGGWLITILAICLGAPFWFDVLGKVANLRSSIKPK